MSIRIRLTLRFRRDDFHDIRFARRRFGGLDVRDGNLPGRLDPFARLRDVGVGANGVRDGVGRDHLDFVDALDEVSERGAQVALAAVEESHGVGMAVDGGFIGEIVIGGDFGGALPVEGGFLDGLSFGMAADAGASLTYLRPPGDKLALVAGKFRNFRIDDVVIHVLLRP